MKDFGLRLKFETANVKFSLIMRKPDNDDWIVIVIIEKDKNTRMWIKDRGRRK